MIGQLNPIISGNSLILCSKLKYLGCGCTIRSVDIAPAVGKFYSQFNNIMANTSGGIRNRCSSAWSMLQVKKRNGSCSSYIKLLFVISSICM